MAKEEIITNDYEFLKQYANDSEVEKVLEYINRYFKTDGTSHGQYENCVRLSNYLKENEIIIGEIEAEKLLSSSPKLVEMFKALSLASILLRISNLTNISVLLESYCIKNNVELTRDNDLALYERSEGNDIDLSLVADWFYSLYKEYNIKLWKCGYDQKFAKDFLNRLEEITEKIEKED